MGTVIENLLVDKYSEYKDSDVEWLGVIPSHWAKIKIKNIANIYNGDSLSENKKAKYESEDKTHLAYISSKDIDLDTSVITYENGLRIPRNEPKYKVAKSYSSLICIEGGSAGRKIAFTNQDVCFVNKLACVSAKNNFNSKFLYFTLKGSLFQTQFKLALSGMIGGVAISSVNNFYVLAPSLTEQKVIADFLDRKTALIDQAIDYKHKQIELLKERRQILIQKAVTRGLNSDVKMKHSGNKAVGDIPEHWQINKLRNSLKPVSIKNHPDLPLLSITRELGVIERNIDDPEENHNFIPDDLAGYKLIKTGQFGMNKMKAWQGSYGISSFTGIVSPAYFVFDLISDIVPTFFHLAIRSKFYIPFFVQASDGVRIGQWDLSKERMKEIPIIIPPVDEQMQIVSFIDRASEKIMVAINAKEQEIEKLKEYKATLINSAVTGKIKVFENGK